MMIDLRHGDCLQVLKMIPDGSVNLVLTDPPYNIGVQSQRGGKKTIESWDKIPNYIDWCIDWLLECQRVLKPNGVLYFWHNDMAQIAELMEAIRTRTNLVFVSFCIWDKGNSYRAQSWHRRDPDGKTALRSWFNVCEYCLHFFNAPSNAEASWKHTGLERIKSNPECYKPLKDWIAGEMARLGLTDKDIARKYTDATGRKPYMLRHYFRNSQFEIPTRKVWESVYIPLGFNKSYEELRQSCEELRQSYEELRQSYEELRQSYEELRQSYEELRQSYEELRQSYEELRQSYEELRNVHNVDAMHCNVWHIPPIPSTNRLHTCQKPVEILERLICVSSNEGATVLDCFMGSGSTGVACINTGRDFIGIEKDERYFEVARKRVEETKNVSQCTFGGDMI